MLITETIINEFIKIGYVQFIGLEAIAVFVID